MALVSSSSSIARNAAIAALACMGTAVTAASAAAPPAGGPAAAGRYVGRTAQGIAVQLGAPRHRRRTFRYRARLHCNDGSTFLDRYFTDAVAVRDGRFAAALSSDHGAVRTSVRGRIAGRRARGTLRIVERYSEVPNPSGDTPLDANGAIVCDSHTVGWSATHRGG